MQKLQFKVTRIGLLSINACDKVYNTIKRKHYNAADTLLWNVLMVNMTVSEIVCTSIMFHCRTTDYNGIIIVP